MEAACRKECSTNKISTAVICMKILDKKQIEADKEKGPWHYSSVLVSTQSLWKTVLTTSCQTSPSFPAWLNKNVSTHKTNIRLLPALCLPCRHFDSCCVRNRSLCASVMQWLGSKRDKPQALCSPPAHWHAHPPVARVNRRTASRGLPDLEGEKKELNKAKQMNRL